jgi:hypothetical protein
VMLKIAVPDVVYVRVTRRNLHRIRHKPPRIEPILRVFGRTLSRACQIGSGVPDLGKGQSVEYVVLIYSARD